MKTRNFKIMSLLLGIIILFSALSGCGNKETNTNEIRKSKPDRFRNSHSCEAEKKFRKRSHKNEKKTEYEI